MASLCGDVEVSKTVNVFAKPFTSRAEKRIVGEEEAYGLFAPIYDRIRPRFPGMFARTEDWWRLRRLADPEHRRAGGGVLNRVLVCLDGKPEGYALYRLHQTIEQGFSTGFLNVIEAIGATPEATREVWRFLFDVDWIGRVKAALLPPDHPLFFLIARPRALRYHALDALWVRLVDIPRALAARTIAPEEPVVIEVADDFCPWNAGRYRIASGDVARTEAAADLALDVTALGSVYLGGFTFAQLGAAGRIEERRTGALARADALFPRDAAPWCPEVF
jgi:predicted acetyltransferase